MQRCDVSGVRLGPTRPLRAHMSGRASAQEVLSLHRLGCAAGGRIVTTVKANKRQAAISQRRICTIIVINGTIIVINGIVITVQ